MQALIYGGIILGLGLLMHAPLLVGGLGALALVWALFGRIGLTVVALAVLYQINLYGSPEIKQLSVVVAFLGLLVWAYKAKES